MKNNVSKSVYNTLVTITFAIFFMCSQIGWSQEAPVITQKIDTAAIQIGDQINYQVSVTADSTATVLFPEEQTFSPLEMVEASKIDTVKENRNFIFSRKYALTQFDSGAYYIPRQRIVVNGKPFLLDSIPVHVAGVTVDTTKQKMYDIKPLQEVEEAGSNWGAYVLWILLPLLLIALVVWWFVFRKKPLTEEEKIALLPPFERAMEGLKTLEKSKYIIESKHKEYYSELTTIVKRYLEEETNISALESTTDELFLKIEMLQEAGQIKLEGNTIKDFKKVLQTADLVKFARMKPQDDLVQNHTKVIEGVVVETKESLPEPTEEELEESEAYREEFLRRRKKKRIITAAIVSVAVIFLAVGGAIAYYGFTNLKDTVLGHPTKELLETDWVTSEYGFPPLKLETPKVLKRVQTVIPEGQDTIVKSIKTFQYGSILDQFYVAAGTVQYQKGYTIKAEASIQNRLSYLEQNGVTNMITKNEEFTSKDGVKGVKVYGTASFPMGGESKQMVKGNYEIILFANSGGYEQALVILYREDDIYAEPIIRRIESSIEVNTLLKSTQNKPQ